MERALTSQSLVNPSLPCIPAPSQAREAGDHDLLVIENSEAGLGRAGIVDHADTSIVLVFAERFVGPVILCAGVYFLTRNTPGGFEEILPDIVKWFAEHPLEDVAGPERKENNLEGQA